MNTDKQPSKVLIVEDCPADTELCRRLLGQDPDQAHVILVATSGEEGLRLCWAEHPDCVLLDYSLPDMSGLDFLAQLGAEKEKSPIPAIMLTDRGDETVAVEAMRRGSHDYITKRDLTSVRLGRAISGAIEKATFTRRLREKDEELQHFAFTAAHDLKAPLRRMSGFCEFLLKDYGDQLDEKGKEYLDYIVSNARQLTQLVETLLEYSRVGRSDRQPRRVDLNEVVKRVLATHAPTLAESGARFDVGPLPTVLGDEVTLGQLFQNLVGNALKFRGETAPAVRIGTRLDGGMWRITVADNGIGIDPSNHAKVFKPFVRLHDQATEGSGIGLATCRKVVDQHGGRIWIESRPGQGAAVHFTLPNVLGPRPQVLVAEDDAGNQRLIQRHLEKLGCCVDLVERGDDAAQAAGTKCYDLILLDFHMPGLNGADAARAIHARNAHADHRVPIVAITADDRQEVREKYEAAGVDDYLLKPVRLEEFKQVLERWIAGPASAPEETERRQHPGRAASVA